MANMENKYKHMDYVQSAISRMASNSFHIKVGMLLSLQLLWHYRLKKAIGEYMLVHWL